MKKISRFKKAAIFGVAFLLCGSLVYFVSISEPELNIQVETSTDYSLGMPVSVRLITARSYPARITSLGEVLPRYQTSIKTQVAGRISHLSDQLKEGRIVRSGELLVRLEKSRFLVQMANAESHLKETWLNLLKEEREAKSAKKNWKRSGIKDAPASSLVLRIPQVEAARSAYNAAQAALQNARNDLDDTEIKVPYDGVIMKRSVNPGETLFTGNEVAVLYSLEAVEVGIHLDAAQWQLLPRPILSAVGILTDPLQKASWKASVIRKAMHVNRETRLRNLTLETLNPLQQNPPLLPGTFVQVALTGKHIPGLLCIPEPALTKAGLVWLVDKQGRLASYRSDPVFYGDGLVYIQSPTKEDKAVRVAVSPNSSFTNGLLVQPVINKERN